MNFNRIFIYGGDFVSATIGAALKKIAVSLLTDKKVIKIIGGIIIGHNHSCDYADYCCYFYF